MEGKQQQSKGIKSLFDPPTDVINRDQLKTKNDDPAGQLKELILHYIPPDEKIISWLPQLINEVEQPPFR